MTSSDVFEGIASVAQLGTAIVLGLGVWVAYRQLYAWREQDIQKKRADIAEELLAASLEVSDILRALRTPFDSIPEGERDNRNYVYEKRLDRFNEAAERFQTLRRLQIRANAVLGNGLVDEATNVLFEVRQKTIVAIQMLHDRRDVYGDEDDATRQMYEECRRDMWGIYSEKYDPLGMKQLGAIEILEKHLPPFVRYDKVD